MISHRLPVRSPLALAGTAGLLVLAGAAGMILVGAGGSCSSKKGPSPGGGQGSKYRILAFEELSEGLPLTGTWLGYPRLHDLNGDGYADLVASNREEDGYSVWEAPKGGLGAWTLRNQGIPRDMMYGSAAFGDFNQDGSIDLAVNSHSDGLRVFLNDGTLHGGVYVNGGSDPETGEPYGDDRISFTETTTKIQNLFLLLDVAVGNLNGDEYPDAAGIGHFKGGVAIFSGDGKGGMRRMPESSALIDGGVFGREIELVDLDGNGLDDIVTTSNIGGQILLTYGGESLYWENVSEGLPNPEIGNTIYGVTVGDFVEGGQPEVAFAAIYSERDPAERNSFGVYGWNAAEKRWDSVTDDVPRDQAYRDVKSADFDMDGHLDLLLCNVDEGPMIYLGDGRGGFRLAGVLDGTGRARCHVGDVDGDGRPDVAIAFSSKGTARAGVRVYLNRAQAFE